jgi:hypothetical protein
VSEPVAVHLHRALYMQQAIKEAAQQFSELASFEVKRQGEYHAVTVADIDPEVDGDLVGEFCNFALVYTATRKRKKVA